MIINTNVKLQDVGKHQIIAKEFEYKIGKQCRSRLNKHKTTDKYNGKV
jgi:hypothetical protein